MGSSSVQQLITQRLVHCGWDADLNDIDVSGLHSMANMFEGTPFHGYLERWNVGHVTNFTSMFENSDFNGDLSGWCIKASAEKHAMLACSTLIMFPRIDIDDPLDMACAITQLYTPSMTGGPLASRAIGALNRRLYIGVESSHYRYQQAVFALCAPYLRACGAEVEPHPSVLAQYDTLRLMYETAGSVHVSASAFAEGAFPHAALPTLS